MRTYEATIWDLWRCDHGRQWTSVRGSWADTDRDGCACQFSGCEPGHTAHIVGHTEDRSTASDWFRRVSP